MRATAVTTIKASLTGPQNSPAPPKNRASAIPDRISATIATQPDRLARRSRSAVALIDLTVLRDRAPEFAGAAEEQGQRDPRQDQRDQRDPARQARQAIEIRSRHHRPHRAP